MDLSVYCFIHLLMLKLIPAVLISHLSNLFSFVLHVRIQVLKYWADFKQTQHPQESVQTVKEVGNSLYMNFRKYQSKLFKKKWTQLKLFWQRMGLLGQWEFGCIFTMDFKGSRVQSLTHFPQKLNPFVIYFKIYDCDAHCCSQTFNIKCHSQKMRGNRELQKKTVHAKGKFPWHYLAASIVASVVDY